MTHSLGRTSYYVVGLALLTMITSCTGHAPSGEKPADADLQPGDLVWSTDSDWPGGIADPSLVTALATTGSRAVVALVGRSGEMRAAESNDAGSTWDEVDIEAAWTGPVARGFSSDGVAFLAGRIGSRAALVVVQNADRNWAISYPDGLRLEQSVARTAFAVRESFLVAGTTRRRGRRAARCVAFRR